MYYDRAHMHTHEKAQDSTRACFLAHTDPYLTHMHTRADTGVKMCTSTDSAHKFAIVPANSPPGSKQCQQLNQTGDLQIISAQWLLISVSTCSKTVSDHCSQISEENSDNPKHTDRVPVRRQLSEDADLVALPSSGRP